jgi:hypothetical protein
MKAKRFNVVNALDITGLTGLTGDERDDDAAQDSNGDEGHAKFVRVEVLMMVRRAWPQVHRSISLEKLVWY